LHTSLNRRGLLVAAGAAAAGAALPARAHVDPSERRATAGAPYKLAVAAYSYRKFLTGPGATMTLFDFIRKCAEMGADGVELTEYYFQKPVTPEYVMRLKREAHLWGQSITGTPIGNTFTHPAGDLREKELAKFRDWVDISANLGSPTIRTFAGVVPKGLSEEAAVRNAIETLEIACEHAARRGVFLGLENHGGVVAEADNLLKIVKSVKSPWLGVNLDTGNFHTADPYGDLAKIAPYAVSVQHKVAIQQRGKPKEEADFRKIVRICRDANYRGFITLEYEEAEDPMVAVPRILAHMRRILLEDARAV